MNRAHHVDIMKPIDLIAHPEGGRFRRVFKSETLVRTPAGTWRSALTHIYFSLSPGEKSRFQCITLSCATNAFCHVIPAGIWQAAEPVADTVLAGCSVAPGFEYADFELIDPDSDYAKRLASIAPALSRFIVSGPTDSI